MIKKPRVKTPRSRHSKTNVASPIFRSDALPSLREALGAIDQLKQIIGSIAIFHIVVDANILIGDVLWLLDRRKKASAQTSLQECIIAGTIIAYVTPAVINEVEEKLAVRVIKRGLSVDSWVSIWGDYKTLLTIREPDHAKVAQYACGQDPDDAPTLALADILAACGILTRDSDIAAMGGNTIPIGFVLQARDYSRKAAISISIQVGGYYFIVGASEALRMLVTATEQCREWFRKQPGFVKIGAFLVLASLVIHPKSRTAIVGSLRAISGKLPDILPQILQMIVSLVDMVEANEAVPPVPPAASFKKKEAHQR